MPTNYSRSKKPLEARPEFITLRKAESLGVTVRLRETDLVIVPVGRAEPLLNRLYRHRFKIGDLLFFNKWPNVTAAEETEAYLIELENWLFYGGRSKEGRVWLVSPANSDDPGANGGAGAGDDHDCSYGGRGRDNRIVQIFLKPSRAGRVKKGGAKQLTLSLPPVTQMHQGPVHPRHELEPAVMTLIELQLRGAAVIVKNNALCVGPANRIDATLLRDLHLNRFEIAERVQSASWPNTIRRDDSISIDLGRAN